MKYDPRADRAKRGSALARPELRTGILFNRVENRMPEKGRNCTCWAADVHGNYCLPFPVVLKDDDRWYNAVHDRRLAITIIGWNYRP